MFPLSTAQIAAALGVKLANVVENWPLIEQVLDDLGIGSDASKIAALATIRVEDPPFRPIREYGPDSLHEKMYAHRMGNTEPGDGAKYAGRGEVQITGKDNYGKYGAMIGVDLISDPDKALNPWTSAALFGAYWWDHKLAEAADRGDWIAVRRRVNGGLNGWTDFMGYVRKLQVACALAALNSSNSNSNST